MIELIWIDISGYEGLYQVSNSGLIKNKNTGKIKKYHYNRDGYLYVSLSKSGKSKTLKVHRIVCESFNIKESEEKNHVDHIDGDKSNNSSLNLRWCSHAENIKFAWDNGLYKNKGQNHGMSKISEKQAIYIKGELKSKRTAKSIAKELSIGIDTVFSIKQGRTWVHIK